MGPRERVARRMAQSRFAPHISVAAKTYSPSKEFDHLDTCAVVHMHMEQAEGRCLRTERENGV